MRAAIAARIPDLAAEASAYSHQRNYHRLHARRDGSTSWTEAINSTDDLIDSGADHFAPVPSLTVQGVGSYYCDCDYCNEVYNADDEARAIAEGRKYARADKYGSQADAIADSVADGDNSCIEDEMQESLDAIPIGYFDDEAI